MTKQASVFVFLFLFAAISAYPQVAVNSNGAVPDESAMLDISSTDKGLLIPRMVITDIDSDISPVENPSTGLLIFNTGSAQVDAGFYTWTGNKWALMINTESSVINTIADMSAEAGEIYDDNMGGTPTTLAFGVANTYYGWLDANAGIVLGSVATDVGDATSDKLVAGEAGIYRVMFTSSHKVGDGFAFAGEEVVATVFHTHLGTAAETHIKFRTHIWLHEVFFPSAVGSAQGFLSLEAGDAVDIRFKSDAAPTEMELFVVSLTIEKIGEIPAP